MKRFTGAPWPSKINYVDKNNVILGFANSQDCCEDFGHGVYAKIPTSTQDPELDNVDLEPYSFAANAKPIDCLESGECGGGLAFKITAKNKKSLYVVIWNHHNGYYSHGFVWKNEEGSL